MDTRVCVLILNFRAGTSGIIIVLTVENYINVHLQFNFMCHIIYVKNTFWFVRVFTCHEYECIPNSIEHYSIVIVTRHTSQKKPTYFVPP